jgi:hypothetical protein
MAVPLRNLLCDDYLTNLQLAHLGTGWHSRKYPSSPQVTGRSMIDRNE